MEKMEKSIIDIHCHVAGIGAGGSGCFISHSLRRSWRYPVFLRSFRVTEQELLQHGDGLVTRRLAATLADSRRVAAAVILAVDGAVDDTGELDRDATEMFVPNEYAAGEAARYSNLLFGASVNPYRPDAVDRLEWCAAHGAVLLKWLPVIQRIDPVDLRLVPFYRRLKELGLPLLSHTGCESSFTRSCNELGDPERLRLPLSLGVTVIAAHAGGNGRNCGERNQDRFLRLCREYPGFYGDISALTQVNRPGLLQRLLKQKDLYGRFLYGTDMPLPRSAAVTPFAFPLRLSPRRMLEIRGIGNPWDRDVALKEALGVEEEIFHNADKILPLKSTP